ncbi:MAG: HD domain-containing protein [Clostridia bacterium]|nr:HD domain-containing protein [Clostridia bacterium]
MIDFEKAQKAFNTYLNNFDINNSMIKLKIIHTYKVVELSEYIAKDLDLSIEDIELAKIIGLLHDIGRFNQAKVYNDFRDYRTENHAILGINVLFGENKIRDFIDDDKYDMLIYKAILNHNKLKIEDGLNEKELLHSKIIRDADKADNFRVKQEEEIENLLYMAKDLNEIENAVITEKIFNDYLQSKLIINEDRITSLDHWISYFAFIFDFNFSSGLKFIMEKDYINRNLDRINYKNIETKRKIEIIRKHSLEYVNNKIIQSNKEL